MSNLVKQKFRPWGLILIIIAWSLAMGWLLTGGTSTQAANPVDSIGTVDVIPAQYELGQELYLENCATCHIGIPPAVLPTQTWRNLLQDEQHYGTIIKPLVDPQRILVWRYLLTFSRVQLKDEETPYRLNNSRYFKALHPQIKLPRPVQLGSCISCHPSVKDFNFRNLSPEWK
jgi:hypothetical protein